MAEKIKKSLACALAVAVFCTVTLAIYFNSHNIFVMLEESGIFKKEIEISVVEGDGLGLRLWTPNEIEASPFIVIDQSLMLINTEYRLPDDFDPRISEYKDTGVYMNKCMLEAYAALSASVTEEYGKKLYVSSDFRSAEEQEQLYLEDPLTATEVGASEHQSGLALDVYVARYAGDSFIKSKAGRYVNSKCCKYGFIIRYPSYGEAETGIRFEPWHIRYVGQPHAEIIYNNQLTLEEYILSLQVGEWYEVGEYFICRQSIGESGEISLPERFEKCVISPDNTGYYIVTVQK